MQTLAPGSPTYALLYTDEHGDEVGLEEVQWLETVPADRLRDTEALLRDESLFVRFQAALILTAWGKDSGLEALRDLISKEASDGQNLSPHRLTGQDNRFDDMADAIDMYVMADGDRHQAVEALRALLHLYPTQFFESKLKWVLSKFSDDGIAGDVRSAILQTQQNGRVFQASQLLPVLAKADAKACWDILPLFSALPPQTPDPAANVAEALGWIDQPGAADKLKQYLASPSASVAESARQALKSGVHQGG